MPICHQNFDTIPQNNYSRPTERNEIALDEDGGRQNSQAGDSVRRGDGSNAARRRPFGAEQIAKRLASELNWPVFSSDEIRKTLAGVPLTQRTPSELRPTVYSAQMTRRTYRKLIGDGLAAIGSCRGRRPRPLQLYNAVILDATFSTRALRKFLRNECKKANVSIQFIELEVSPDEIKKRLKLRDEKTAEASDARLEDFDKLTATYEPLSGLAPDSIRVSTNASVSDTVKTILVSLAENQSIVANNTSSPKPR